MSTESPEATTQRLRATLDQHIEAGDILSAVDAARMYQRHIDDIECDRLMSGRPPRETAVRPPAETR